MELQIRQCEVTDAPAIQVLNAMEMRYDYPLDKTREKLQQLLQSGADKIFVAVVEGAVVGYVHANDHDVIYAPPMKNIMGIAVLSDYKKKGIGRALLAAVENWAQKKEAAGVRLVSGAKRTAAHDFYRHCGYGNERQQLNFKKMF